MPEECNSCHAEIDWCVKFPEEVNLKTGLPKTIPIDHGSWNNPKGNIVAWRGEALPLRDGTPGPSLIYARYLKKDEEPGEGEHRGISHFATCPEAGQWRGRSRSAPDSPGRSRSPGNAVIICTRPGQVITAQDRQAVEAVLEEHPGATVNEVATRIDATRGRALLCLRHALQAGMARREKTDPGNHREPWRWYLA